MTPKKRAAATRSKKGQLSAETLWKRLRSIEAKCWYVIGAGTVLMITLFLIAITPERYDLKVGDISYTTITASKDVVDEIATERNRDDAARAVEPTYLYQDGVTADVMHDLTSVLTQANTVQQYGQKTLGATCARRRSKAKGLRVYNSGNGICQIPLHAGSTGGLSDQHPATGYGSGNAGFE